MTSLPLAALVETSAAVGATRSRKEKTAALAELLSATAPDEVALVVALIAGDPRQGRIGIGWSTLSAVETTPAAEASLTVADLDVLLDEVAATTGEGSTAARHELLRAVLAAATEAEADFMRRLLLGELRQGANEGLVVEGVAKASGVKAAVVRRALMLSGDLGLVTETAVTAGAEGLAAIGLQLGRPMRPMLASTASGVSDA
ncbi:MAG: ATP-dependent DNA ligase, partial [Actinomycetota bacterium]